MDAKQLAQSLTDNAPQALYIEKCLEAILPNMDDVSDFHNAKIALSLLSQALPGIFDQEAAKLNYNCRYKDFYPNGYADNEGFMESEEDNTETLPGDYIHYSDPGQEERDWNPVSRKQNSIPSNPTDPTTNLVI